MKNSVKIRHICMLALMIALAFAFSYLETLIPYNFGVPGIKLGIANLVVLTSLYLMSERDAFVISVVRIVLCGFLFYGMFSIVYSLAGGLLSYLIMLLLKKSGKFTPTGVSAAGGTAHNIGQIAVAAFVIGSNKIFYYLPALLIAGLVTGIINGIISNILISRLKHIIEKYRV